MQDARALSDSLLEYDPEMLDYVRVIEIEADRNAEEYQASLENAVRFLKDTNYRYFYAASNDPFGVLEEAFKQGIAGTGDHHWIFSGAGGDIADAAISYERDSPLHLMLRGVIQEVAIGALESEADEAIFNPQRDS